MIRDITIGKYYYNESIIHKLDPRTKIIFTMFYIAWVLVCHKWIEYLMLALILAGYICMTQIPCKYILRGMKSMTILLIVTLLLNVAGMGINKGLLMGVRLILLIIGSSMLTFTTTPNALTDGFESLFKPLKFFKVPVSDIAMMMCIALRFIPIMVDESGRIMDAQKARGADFESGNIIKRIGKLMPLIVPLFVSAYKKALELSLAMEARCYQGGENRTKMKSLKYNKTDGVAFIIAAMLTVAMGFIHIKCS